MSLFNLVNIICNYILMNKKSKKMIRKRYIRFEKARISLKKNRKKAYSKKLFKKRHKNRKNIRSRRLKRKRLNRKRSYRNSNMRGGGLPFGGTIKGLLGLTHNDEKSRENMIGNLCALNNVRPTTDTQISGILNQVCSLDQNVKNGKKDNSVVKGAMRLIGNMATLPLRTASGVVKNVTGFDASEAAYNAIKNSVTNEEKKTPQINIVHPQTQKQPLSGGQHMEINHTNKRPQIQTGIHARMQGGTQINHTVAPPIHDVSKLQTIQNKLSSGGSLTDEEIKIIGNL
jgi:hypothetical protein